MRQTASSGQTPPCRDAASPSSQVSTLACGIIYTHEFDDVTAPFYLPWMSGFQSLADHAADNRYVFGGGDGGPTESSFL
jgi:hypothetical protein